MALLRPWVGKVNVYAGERRARQARDNIDRVGAQYANVGKSVRLDPAQQGADARPVHLDRQEIMLRPRRSDLGRRLSHPGADLEHDRERVAENGREVERRRRRNAEARIELVARTLLRRRHAPLAQDEAADRSMNRRNRCRRCDCWLGRRSGTFADRAHHFGCAIFHDGSPSRRSIVRDCASVVAEYSITTVSAPFHVTLTSDQGACGAHVDSLRTPWGSMRQTATSLSQPVAQKSAVTK